MYTLCYIGDYKRDEEGRFRHARVDTVRLSDPLREVRSWAAMPIKGKAIIRSERLSGRDFDVVSEHAKAAGIELATSARAFEIATSLSLQHSLLRGLSPKALFLPLDTPSQVILESIRSAGLRLPLFVRGEFGSAAKYVGIDRCTIARLESQSISDAVGAIVANLPKSKELIVKEIEPIAVAAGGERLEYRAVGVGGSLVGFDFEEMPGRLPPPSANDLERFASTAFKVLASGGASGALFLDVAVLEGDDRRIVVECKDFHFGTIAHPEALAAGLRSLNAPGELGRG